MTGLGSQAPMFENPLLHQPVIGVFFPSRIATSRRKLREVVGGREVFKKLYWAGCNAGDSEEGGEEQS